MRRVVNYIRVSSEGQATEGVSLDAQRAKLTAYCVAMTTEMTTMTTKTEPTKRPTKRPTKAPKEDFLHLRLDREDRDALDALATRTGLERSTLARLALRAGIRVGERDPGDLLAPAASTTKG